MRIELKHLPYHGPNSKLYKKIEDDPYYALSPNSRKSKHWGALSKAKEGAKDEIIAIIKQQERPSRPYNPAYITITWVVKDKKPRDIDNLGAAMKPYIDGIVAAGVIVDDSDKHVTYAPFNYEYGSEEKTIIQVDQADKPTPQGVFCPYCKCRLPNHWRNDE